MMTVDLALVLQTSRLLAAGLLVAASGYAIQHRNEHVAAAFIWTVVSLTAWGWLTMVPNLFGPSFVTGFSQTVVSMGVPAAGGCAVVFWFVYIRRYTGHRQYATTRRVLVMLSPVGVNLAIRVLMVTPLTSQVAPVSGVLAVVYTTLYLYLAALFVLGIYLLFRLAQRYRQVPTTQVAVLGVAIAAPVLAVLVSTLTRPVEDGTTVSILPVDVSSLGFLLSAFAFVYAIRTYSLFTTFPEAEYVARDEVLEDLTEALFILDPSNQIVDMNAAAADLCQQAAEDTIGQPIDAVFDDLSHIPTDGVQRTTIQTPTGPRQFEISASALQDGDNARLGTTLLARDITAKTTRDQQLAVLTRVLRHNLRNDIDTALAHTNEIADPDVQTTIRSKLHSLAELGTNARAIDEVVSKAHEPRSEIDVVDVVHSVTEQLAGENNCEIEVETPAELRIVTHRWLLSRLLTELVQNGITHSKQPTPHIDVVVEHADRHDGPVTIKIADNGPGIPAHEQAAMHDEAETPLEHGSGVGLWLANWITESLGGELAFDQREPTGTTVTVTLWPNSKSS